MNLINITPTIYLSDDLRTRCYVYFSFRGEPHRLYSGKALGISCHPGREKTIKGRHRELTRLLEATRTALQSGCWQYANRKLTLTPLPDPADSTAQSVIRRQQMQFDKLGWSKPYLRDMNRISNELLVFLTTEDLA